VGQNREIAEEAKILSIYINTRTQSVRLVQVPGNMQIAEIIQKEKSWGDIGGKKREEWGVEKRV
jgi:hypothetical protein